MKKNILTIIAILFCFLSLAQTESYGIVTYKAPKGWKKASENSFVSYTITNNAKNNYCIISIYYSVKSKGNADAEFNSEWTELAATPFSIKETPQINKAKDDDGREVINGMQTFTDNNTQGVAMLTTYVGFGLTTSILALTNDQSYVETIMEFLNNVTLLKLPSGSLPANTATSVTPSPKTSTNTTATNSTSAYKHSNNLEGVWMAIHSKNSYYDFSSGGTPKWITFLDNGRAQNSVPDDIFTFNKNASDLGYYQISGGNASLKWFDNAPWGDITFKNNDQIVTKNGGGMGNENYYRCKPVDGTLLEGSWTSYADPNDPSLDAREGDKPVIQFSKNGNFTDYGIFTSVLDMNVFDRAHTSPGSGTYQIDNFSLTLHYNNGAVRKISFTGFLGTDVKTNDKNIYLQGLGFSKRN